MIRPPKGRKRTRTSWVAILAFTYDWGYFRAMGITFATAPTSIADHIRSGLDVASVWVPLWLILFAGHLFLLRVEKEGGYFDGLRVRVEASPGSARAKGWVLAISVGVALIVLVLFEWRLGDLENEPPDSGTAFIILVAAFAMLWPTFVGWAFERPRVKERFSYLSRLGATVVPITLLFFSWFGFLAAKADKRSRSSMMASVHQVCHTEAEICPKSVPVRVYRSFSEWVLVGDSIAVYWVRSTHVDRMQAPTEHKPVDEQNGDSGKVHPDLQP